MGQPWGVLGTPVSRARQAPTDRPLAPARKGSVSRARQARFRLVWGCGRTCARPAWQGPSRCPGAARALPARPLHSVRGGQASSSSARIRAWRAMAPICWEGTVSCRCCSPRTAQWLSPALEGPCAPTFCRVPTRPTSSCCVAGRCVSRAANGPTSATGTRGWRERTTSWSLGRFSCDSRRLSARPEASCWQVTARAAPLEHSCPSRGAFRRTRACRAPPGRSRLRTGARRASHALLVASWQAAVGARATCADMDPSRRAAGPRRACHARQAPSRIGWGPLSARCVRLACGRLKRGRRFASRATAGHTLAARGTRPAPCAGERRILPRGAALRRCPPTRRRAWPGSA